MKSRGLLKPITPIYRGNLALCRKETFMNLFLLSFGFKRLFGINLYEYYTSLRMDRAKQLLNRGESVFSIAMELEFSSGRAFGKAFDWYGWYAKGVAEREGGWGRKYY